MSDPDVPDVKATLTALVRVAYAEMMTVIALSVAFVLTFIPIVTLGAGMIALSTTMRTVVAENEPRTERARLRLFFRTVRDNLVSGLPYGVGLVLTWFAVFVYASIVASAGAGGLLAATVVGLYALGVVPAWLLRVANLASSGSMPFRSALQRGGHLAVEYPMYTLVHLFLVGVLVAVCSIVPIALLVLLPGLLAVLEAIAYAELAGDGARTVLEWYRNHSARARSR